MKTLCEHGKDDSLAFNCSDCLERIKGQLTAKKAQKHDTEKPRYDLLPPEALEELVKVLTFGANKYADRNWELGLKYGRVFGAAQRHLWAWWGGQDKDEETGLSHLAHAMCCLSFLLTYEARDKGEEFDDRPSRPDSMTIEEYMAKHVDQAVKGDG